MTLAAPEFQLDQWRDSDLLTDSLWILGSRAKGEGRIGSYHGNFVPQIPDQFIRRFTKPGDVVLDMFAGSETTVVESLRLGRHCLGIELNDDVRIETLRRLLPVANPHGVDYAIVRGDSSDPDIVPIASVFPARSGKLGFNLTFLHPPYWNVVKYSEDDTYDLSHASSVRAFEDLMRIVARNAQDLTVTGGHLALVIADICHKGEFIPLGFRTIAAVESGGWELRGICVKDMVGNERGKGKHANLWRYRCLKNGTFTFGHEYIALFRRRGR